jgi:hypothetical protein
LPALESWAVVSGQIDRYNEAYNSQQYAQLLAMFSAMRDEEDIELLLMHS